MNTETAATNLEALGSSTRLEIFRLLVRAGQKGAMVGELQKHLDIPASTLSHHLTRLIHVGLVCQERQGRSLICRANYSLMNSLLEFLVAECCEGIASSDHQTGEVA